MKYLSFLVFIIMIHTVGCDFFNEKIRDRNSASKNQNFVKAGILGLAETKCTKDSDCVLVDSTCCSCNAGGEFVSVHKFDQAKFENRLKAGCKLSGKTMCAQVYKCNIKEAASAQCINQLCSY